jgi:hypothetical protein
MFWSPVQNLVSFFFTFYPLLLFYLFTTFFFHGYNKIMFAWKAHRFFYTTFKLLGRLNLSAQSLKLALTTLVFPLTTIWVCLIKAKINWVPEIDFYKTPNIKFSFTNVKKNY